MEHYRILTISGWTQPADALHPLIPHADILDYADAQHFDAVADRLAHTDYDAIVGWSLGGVIARQLILRGVISPKAVVMISSPFQFVQDERVSAAMPVPTFDLFYSNYRDDTQRTIDRFHGLVAKNDLHDKRVLRELTHHPLVEETQRWLPWMDILRTYSGHDQDYSALPPVLIIHGTEDVIVPFAQAEHLIEAIPSARLDAWQGCGHAPHIHDPVRMQESIQQFLHSVIG